MSIPSHPVQMLRTLLPSGVGEDVPNPIPLTDGEGIEDDGSTQPSGQQWRGDHPGAGPPPYAHAQAHSRSHDHSHAHSHTQANHRSHAPLRSDGSPPMSVHDATRLADSLADSVRQNPFHPLFREVATAPPDVFRQWVVQALTRQLSAAQGLPVQVMAGARDAVSSSVAAEARAQSDALRAAVQAQAQNQAHNQPQAPPHAAAAERLAARTGDEARMPLPGAPTQADGRSANEVRAGLAHPPVQGPRADIAPGAPALPPGVMMMTPPGAQAPAGDAACTPAMAGQPPVAAESTHSADTLIPAPQVRPPNEGVILPARAGGGDSLGGLPGMTAAAGITLAAVASPAGTTFAHAPPEALRARQSGAGRAKDAQHDSGEASDETGPEPDVRSRADGDGSDADRGSGGPAVDVAENRPVRSAPAAGHTVAAAGLGLSLADDGNEDSDLHLPGHTVDRSADDGRAPRDPRQWLYWSLIAVTYACLALALATVSPLAPSLPFAAEALPDWRNGLTAAGLATGLWAWLLARRMR